MNSSVTGEFNLHIDEDGSVSLLIPDPETEHISPPSATGLSYDATKAMTLLNCSGVVSFVAYCSVIRFIRQNMPLMTSWSFFAVITVPKNWSTLAVYKAGQAALKESDVSLGTVGEEGVRRSDGSASGDLVSRRKVLYFVHDDSEIDELVAVACTHRLSIDMGSLPLYRALARLMHCGDLSDTAASFIETQPHNFLTPLFRRGSRIEQTVARLIKGQRKNVPDVLELKTNAGFGPASPWATKLQADIADYKAGKIGWADVDKGILLHGPPGTGKTRFAIALARECGLHLVSTSYADWQGAKDGHLGSLLAAMKRSFNIAKSNAPSLLFIDEIDSIGDRSSAWEYRDYQIKVINGLLQQLDGVEGREGVVVMGACNDPTGIDPAILRSGRLETHIHFPLPDAVTRYNILQHYFPTLRDDPRLHQVARQLAGKSGADIEKISRDVRRLARTERREIDVGDLALYSQPLQKVDEDQLFHVAVHEAGHALLVKLLDIGIVECMQVHDFDTSFPEQGMSRGYTKVTFPSLGYRTRKHILDRIAMNFGGMVAEELIFGDRSTSAGGTSESDLAQATKLAVEMCTVFGMGPTFAYTPGELEAATKQERFSDIVLREEVNLILSREHQRAKHVLGPLKPVILALAVALKTKHRLEESEVSRLMQSAIPRSNSNSKR